MHAKFPISRYLCDILFLHSLCIVIWVHFSFSLCKKYVIQSCGAVYVGAIVNVRYTLPFVFMVVTVDGVWWLWCGVCVNEVKSCKLS